MGHGGLVAYVEEQIERDIALGRLHPSGQFGCEAKLARHYDVCRGTMREALRRLAARGLVVQRPGRKTRAVPLDESLTLENLGLALHDARSPRARWLLEGYFSLRRQVLVELLSDCCARASEWDLDQLAGVCFRLWDAARWASGASCAQVEFELLRMAARVAERPGHVLLVQSLQRAFMGGAAQLLPFLGGEALRQWANCAQNALDDRDTRAIQHELLALLKACDEQVLNAFAPIPQKPASPEPHRAQEDLLSAPASAATQDEDLEARPCMDDRGLGQLEPVAAQPDTLKVRPDEERGLGLVAPTFVHEDTLEAQPDVEERGLARIDRASVQDDILEARPALEERGLGLVAPTVVQDDTLAARPDVGERGLGLVAPTLVQDDTLAARPDVGERGLGLVEPTFVHADALEAQPDVEERGLELLASAPAQDDALGICPVMEEGRLGLVALGPARDAVPEACPFVLSPITAQDDVSEACSSGRARRPGCLVPAVEDTRVLEVAPDAHAEVFTGAPDHREKDTVGGWLHRTLRTLEWWAARLWRTMASFLERPGA